MIVVKYEPYKNDITTVAYPVPKLKYKFQAIPGQGWREFMGSNTFEKRTQCLDRMNRASLSDKSYTQFHVKERYSNKKQHDEIWNKKNTTTRFINKIWKSPKIPKTNTISNACQKKFSFTSPIVSIHFDFSFSSLINQSKIIKSEKS